MFSNVDGASLHEQALRKTGVQDLGTVDLQMEWYKAGLFPMERAVVRLFCYLQWAVGMKQQLMCQHCVLWFQSCVDKAPSSEGWGMTVEDQSTAVWLVNTAVIDRWLPVPDWTGGHKIFLLDSDSEWLIVDKIYYVNKGNKGKFNSAASSKTLNSEVYTQIF